MRKQIRTDAQQERIAGSLPFVQALARRLAASMPHSIDISDLVQDGMIGLIDASHRFDESRGIKFETFAERRVRGAMIDALRRDAWPRGIRRVRRELEAAREQLRHDLGYEPSLSDLANHMGADEARLGRTIVRIKTIESTSPMATGDTVDEASLPPVMVPSEPTAPDKVCEVGEVRARVRAGISALPPARAEDHRDVLLWRSYDEADRGRDRGERVSGLSAPCSRHSATPQAAWARSGARGATLCAHPARQRDAVADGESRTSS